MRIDVNRCDEENICQSSESLVNGLLGEGSTTSKKYRTIDIARFGICSFAAPADSWPVIESLLELPAELRFNYRQSC